VVGVSVIEPTLEYPDLAISFALSNGASYCYSQIKPQEYDNLIHTLQEWRDEFMAIMPELNAKSEAIKLKRAAYDEQMTKMEESMSAARLMQQAMENMEAPNV